jgi:hypothetical protein
MIIQNGHLKDFSSIFFQAAELILCMTLKVRQKEETPAILGKWTSQLQD